MQKVVVLDVGANIGNWSASIVSTLSAAHFIAFEPGEQLYSQLVLIFRDFPNISCVDTTLGKSDQKAILYADGSTSGLSSLTKHRLAHFGLDFNYSEEVEITKLDT